MAWCWQKFLSFLAPAMKMCLPKYIQSKKTGKTVSCSRSSCSRSSCSVWVTSFFEGYVSQAVLTLQWTKKEMRYQLRVTHPSATFVRWLNLFNTELYPQRYWHGGGWDPKRQPYLNATLSPPERFCFIRIWWTVMTAGGKVTRQRLQNITFEEKKSQSKELNQQPPFTSLVSYC